MLLLSLRQKLETSVCHVYADLFYVTQRYRKRCTSFGRDKDRGIGSCVTDGVIHS